MASWMKRTFSAEGVTEYPPGSNLAALQTRFGGSGVVVLCIDVSFSMSGDPLEQAQRGGRGFIEDAVAGGYSIGLVLWDHEILDAVHPTRDAARVHRALDAATARGGTQLVPALTLAERMLMDSDATDKVCVIFSDGSLTDQDDAEAAASRLRSQRVRLLTIGLGPVASRGLDPLASPSQPATTTSTAKTLAHDMRQMAAGLKRKNRS